MQALTPCKPILSQSTREDKCHLYLHLVSSLRHAGGVISICGTGWANNATLGVAGPIIVDGAKRDR